jgi:hypothetical protein
MLRRRGEVSSVGAGDLDEPRGVWLNDLYASFEEDSRRYRDPACYDQQDRYQESNPLYFVLHGSLVGAVKFAYSRRFLSHHWR